MEEPRLFSPFLAHPVATFDTRLEAALVALIGYHFRIEMGRVENPNQPHHHEGFRVWEVRVEEAGAAPDPGMGYFPKEVFPYCDGVVALPLPDGRISFENADAMRWFIREGLPTFVAAPTEAITPFALMVFEANYCCGLFNLREMTDEERAAIMAGDPRFVVGPSESPIVYPQMT